MSGRLAGRTAIITGAADGIGAASARLFAAEGARVIAVDRAETVLAAHAGVAAITPLVLDVTDRDAPARMLEAATANGGGVDILLCAAGIVRFEPVDVLSDESWDASVAVNLTAIFRLARAAVPYLKASNAGRIISIASVNARRSAPGLAAYSSTKHAVAGLSKNLAIELGPFGVTANYICPGMIITGMTRGMLEDEAFAKEWAAWSPLGRLGTADEVARVALFLASDDASYVNGAGIDVDGGAIVKL
jgi:NAD(P)-dependent dehydrogenase (short-subunit alcohol dehydrogenase family)